jgi:hypothetical protein
VSPYVTPAAPRCGLQWTLAVPCPTKDGRPAHRCRKFLAHRATYNSEETQEHECTCGAKLPAGARP